MVYASWLGSHWLTVGIKYLWQALRTWRLLRRSRADVAYAMTPPVFAGFVLYLYSRVFRLRYVIDVHTAALLMPRWRRLQRLQALVCRHAVTTLVTNEHLASIVRSGGGHATIVRDVPVVFPVSTAFEGERHANVAVICSFNYDEPIAAILEAARLCPGESFVFSGDPSRLPPPLLAEAPPNVRFAGFLPDADYGSLLAHADAVMSLTTRDHTMLRGAYEGVYMGRPVIVSDWPLLREAFDSGAVHVTADAADIARGVRELRAAQADFEAGAAQLRQRKLHHWAATRRQLLGRLDPTLAAAGEAEVAEGPPSDVGALG